MVRTLLRLLPAAALLAACVSVSYRGPAERAWAAGDLERAVRAYDEVLRAAPGGERQARALYRLAVIHSLPDGPRPDPQRAMLLLDRLLLEIPDSRYAPQASVLLDLQRRVGRLRELSDALTARAERLRQEADRELTGLRQEVDRARGEADARQERIGQLERRIGRLRTRLDELGAEMERLEEELRRLKQIDFERPP